LEANAEQVELVRRFGRRVYYGDATRLDLLRASGAARAKLLIVAIDDRDQAEKLVELALAFFANTTKKCLKNLHRSGAMKSATSSPARKPAAADVVLRH